LAILIGVTAGVGGYTFVPIQERHFGLRNCDGRADGAHRGYQGRRRPPPGRGPGEGARLPAQGAVLPRTSPRPKTRRASTPRKRLRAFWASRPIFRGRARWRSATSVAAVIESCPRSASGAALAPDAWVRARARLQRPAPPAARSTPASRATGG